MMFKSPILLESQCFASAQQPSVWRNSATKGSPRAHRDYRKGGNEIGLRLAEPYMPYIRMGVLSLSLDVAESGDRAATHRLTLLKRITEPAASPGGIALPADSANLRTEGP